METLFYIFIAVAVAGAYFIREITQSRDAFEESVQWALDTIRPLTAELINDTYIWCDLQTSQFVAQGKTLEDLGSSLKLLNTKKVYMLGDYVFVHPEYAPVLIEGSGEIESIYK